MTGPRPARGSVVRLDLAGAALASAARQPMELEDRLIQILDEVGPSLHRYLVFLGATSGEADDLVQETLIRLSDRLRAREPIVDVRAWVFRVAHNLGLNQVRDRKHLDALSGQEWEALVSMQRDPGPGPEEISPFEPGVVGGRRRAPAGKECRSSGERHKVSTQTLEQHGYAGR